MTNVLTSILNNNYNANHSHFRLHSMNSQPPPPSLAPTSTAVPDINRSPDPIPSRALFGGHQAVEIEHAGQRYLLRITRENKLILTK